MPYFTYQGTYILQDCKEVGHRSELKFLVGKMDLDFQQED